MRGYFGIGIEGVSKPMNLGSLLRTAHAFNASFLFTIGGLVQRRQIENADTSSAMANLPLHEYPDLASFQLPRGCRLVGVELLADALDMPSFRHPPQAAYVLGGERSSLSPFGRWPAVLCARSLRRSGKWPCADQPTPFPRPVTVPHLRSRNCAQRPKTR